jgi:hypothetical protein
VTVTVVSGLPRSGTSMMMQMLEAGGVPLLYDAARAPDEDNPRGYFEYEPVKRLARDASWLPLAEGKAVKVVYSLLRYLPPGRDYRVVFMTRPLKEVVRSQRVMLGRLGTAGSTLDDDTLAAVFEGQLGQLDRWLEAQPGISVLRVRHLDAIRAPERVAASVNHFLGGTLDEPAMAKAVDSRLHRQRA